MPRLTSLLAALFLAGTALVLPAAPARAATTHQVAMSGYAFAPRSLTVTAGDTVTWTNQDQAPHDVKTTSGPAAVHSPMLSKGGSWSHTFTTPGTYGYVCTVHPNMTAQLVVLPAPTPTAHSHPATSAPTPAPTRRSAAAAMPSMDMTHSPHASRSAHADHSADAAAQASETPSAAASASTQSAPDLQNAASTTRPLDPLLLLTGVVAGVSVLCLLLVGSRASAARSESPGGD
ncbi:cupredoxin domain-containing protein [Streptomyces cylindrosporus]|uniref:Cupredoxin family copper-binding protein n=1 Tax=Streptomyces cylindrosporus TaxID=2927583 RepID=A0ABS9Y3P5_9ACTN|nr:cupredoxin family copper-binding protein [Streptomyces cylindrosporus]MCI3271818.1 cupredoxin family copper-binding protein [Streptomyces cylindrosporus]